MDRRGDILAKILILGNSQVGKSSILNQFTEGVFTESIPPTLGIDYKINKVEVDGTEIKLQIWDTAGQERFKSITENFYKGAQGIILVFDLTDQESFSTIRNWLKNIYEKAGRSVVVCLLGNKLDIVEKANVDPGFRIDRKRFVPDHEIDELIKEVPIKFMKSSAKNDININESFQYLASQIKKQKADLGQNRPGSKLKPKPKKSSGCC